MRPAGLRPVATNPPTRRCRVTLGPDIQARRYQLGKAPTGPWGLFKIHEPWDHWQLTAKHVRLSDVVYADLQLAVATGYIQAGPSAHGGPASKR